MAETTTKPAQTITRTDYTRHSKIVRKCAHHSSDYRVPISEAEETMTHALAYGCQKCRGPLTDQQRADIQAFLKKDMARLGL